MSLFGDDDDQAASKPAAGAAQSSSLFDDGPGPAARASASLFDDGGGGDDDDRSPWGMPTPRKASRGEVVRNLLAAAEVPESYVDAFDAMVDAGDRTGANVSADGARRLLATSGLGGGADEQARLLRLVAPGGADGDQAAGLGRGQFNVLLALVALAQEGPADDVSLDSVDERRRNLPSPVLPYLDKLKTSTASDSTAPPPPPEAREPATPPQPQPRQQQQIRRDSLLSPETDPWASPTATTRQQAAPRPQQAAAGGGGETTPRAAAAMPRPPQPVEVSRTTSEITTGTEASHDSAPLGGDAAVAGGWGGYGGAAGGFANGEPGLLGSDAFGDAAGVDSALGGGLGGAAALGLGRGGASGPEEVATVTVLPEKEGVFMFQHRNYEVKSARRGSSVVRRYSDFVWLLDCLHKRYPFRQLALLPPKTLAVNGRHLSSDAAFIEKRRRGLVRFLGSLLRHPVLRDEQLVVMFLTVPTELSVWRKQATISVQEEFAGRDLPPGLEDSLPTNLDLTFDTVRAGVVRASDEYIGLCGLLERLAKRKRGVAADSLRFSQALRAAADETAATYAVDTNDVPMLNDGIRSTAKHLEAAHGLLEDEARAWDHGVLEDLKRQRDCLVGLRDLFERRDRLARNTIPQLERRIEANQAKLQQIRTKPDGATKPGEAEKVEKAILDDKESIVQQHARGVFIRECIRDELNFFQQSQYHISRLHQDWSQERVKYAELQADNWRALSEEVDHMPTGPS